MNIGSEFFKLQHIK